MFSFFDKKLLLTEHLLGNTKWLLTDHVRFLVLYFMKYLLIHGFGPSILLNLPSLCINYFLFILVLFQNNLVLVCLTSTKNAWNFSSNPWNISSKYSKKIDASYCNSFSNKWYNPLNPSKNIDEHGKHSSLEDYSVKIIGTRPPINCHESPIGKNIAIPNTSRFRGKYQIMIGKIVDNAITCIINHNLRYRTTVNSIVMIE